MPNNTSASTPAEEKIVEDLLDDSDLNEYATRGSRAWSFDFHYRGFPHPMPVALETFFPMAHEHLCIRMQTLHCHHPHLRFPFRNSIFPACTMNLGPQSVSFVHGDGGDYPGLPGSIHAFGNFDPTKGGHLIPFELGFFIRFPAGTLALLSSSGIRHGNTPIQPFETRYSFTQYASGNLIRWVTYGCRPCGKVAESVKKTLDRDMEEGWQNQKARLSDFFNLSKDRLRTYERKLKRLSTAAP